MSDHRALTFASSPFYPLPLAAQPATACDQQLFVLD